MSVQLGVVGKPRSGKSTFVAASTSGKTLVLDSDNRWGEVAPLAEGATFEMASRQAFRTPLDLLDELDRIFDDGFKGVVVDSVTKLYSRFARRASMEGRLGRQEREKRGLGAAKYTDMQDKSDAMQVLANIPAYGVDVFFVWHRGSGLNVGKKVQGFREYEMVELDQISQKELETLQASMSMILAFFSDADGYHVRVEEARARGRRKPRTGIVVTDYPGNFWRGGLERIEDLVYQHFSGQDDALEWAAGMLGGDKEDYYDLYTDIKDRLKPKSASEMWQRVVEAVYDELWRREQQQERQVGVDMAEPGAEKTVVAVIEKGKVTVEQVPVAQAEEIAEAGDLFPDAPPEPEEEDRTFREVKLASGEIVDEKAWTFYWKYKDHYGQEPHNLSDIRAAGKAEGWW